MHQAVKVYRSNQRQGTASAKTRSEVAGGSRKPWRQKGTGRARQGTIRAVQWEGGGVAFPPIPGSWRQKLPKKVRSLARRSALNDRAENDRVVIADMPELAKPRTQELVGFLSAVDSPGKVLVLTDGKNENVYLSSRNVANISVLPFGDESVYDVLWAHTVVIERSALEEDRKSKKVAKAEVEATEDEPVVEEAQAEAEAVVEEVAAEEVTEDEAASSDDDEVEASADADAAATEVIEETEAGAEDEVEVAAETEEPVVDDEADEEEKSDA